MKLIVTNSVGDLDLARIFHPQQKGLATVLSIIAKDCRTCSKYLRREALTLMKDCKALDYSSEDQVIRSTYQSVHAYFKETATKLELAATLLDQRICGQQLSSEEKLQIRSGIKKLKEFREKGIRSVVRNTIEDYSNQNLMQLMTMRFFGVR